MDRRLELSTDEYAELDSAIAEFRLKDPVVQMDFMRMVGFWCQHGNQVAELAEGFSTKGAEFLTQDSLVKLFAIQALRPNTRAALAVRATKELAKLHDGKAHRIAEALRTENQRLKDQKKTLEAAVSEKDDEIKRLEKLLVRAEKESGGSGARIAATNHAGSAVAGLGLTPFVPAPDGLRPAEAPEEETVVVPRGTIEPEEPPLPPIKTPDEQRVFLKRLLGHPIAESK
jgi:hypothetical protein